MSGNGCSNCNGFGTATIAGESYYGVPDTYINCSFCAEGKEKQRKEDEAWENKQKKYRQKVAAKKRELSRLRKVEKLCLDIIYNTIDQSDRIMITDKLDEHGFKWENKKLIQLTAKEKREINKE